MSATQKLVLASGSPRRLQLLQQVGIDPDFLSPVPTETVALAGAGCGFDAWGAADGVDFCPPVAGGLTEPDGAP